MWYNILFPVDFSSHGFSIDDYARAFSHLQGKQFSAFFLSDFMKEKNGHEENHRQERQKSLREAATSVKVDLKFIACPGSVLSLRYQSRFADLLVLSPLTGESQQMLTTLLDENIFDDFGCPVLVSANLADPYDEIIFLFDHDPTGLTALKSFHNLFSQISKNKKVTVITVNQDDMPEVFFEESLVHYLRGTFGNVGILPMNKGDMGKNLVTYAARSEHPLLIMGRSAQSLFEDKALLRALEQKKISVYYSYN